MKLKSTVAGPAAQGDAPSGPPSDELRKARWRNALSWLCLGVFLWGLYVEYAKVYQRQLEAAEQARQHGRG